MRFIFHIDMFFLRKHVSLLHVFSDIFCALSQVFLRLRTFTLLYDCFSYFNVFSHSEKIPMAFKCLTFRSVIPCPHIYEFHLIYCYRDYKLPNYLCIRYLRKESTFLDICRFCPSQSDPRHILYLSLDPYPATLSYILGTLIYIPKLYICI
jgi:hypothetical protein